MKKFIFLLILCLGSIKIYAQDTIYCKQSEVTKMTPVVMGIPDSVYCNEATPDQNGQAYFKRNPVVLGRSYYSKANYLGRRDRTTTTEILLFKRSEGFWRNAKTEGSAFHRDSIDWLYVTIVTILGFIIGFIFSIFPTLHNCDKRKIVLSFLLGLVVVNLFSGIFLALSFGGKFWLELIPIIVGMISGLLFNLFVILKYVEKSREKQK